MAKIKKFEINEDNILEILEKKLDQNFAPKFSSIREQYDFLGISPDRDIYLFNNQSAFAKEFGLMQPNISSCLKENNRKTHKDWKFIKTKEFVKKTKEDKIKILTPENIAINEDDEVYFFDNIYKFAEEKDLSIVIVTELLKDKGNPKRHKGYMFLKTEEFYSWNKKMQKDFKKKFDVEILKILD